MSYLALSASFEYVCYGSMAIINILLLQCGDRRVSKEETFCFFSGQSGARTRDLRLSQNALTTSLPGRSASQDPGFNYNKSDGNFRHVWLRNLTNDDGNFRHVWQ